MISKPFHRKQLTQLLERLNEVPKTLIYVTGPRQVGKTTLVHAALRQLMQKGWLSTFISIDQPDIAPAFSGSFDLNLSSSSDSVAGPKNKDWLINIWKEARVQAKVSQVGHILVLDEIQKLPNWSETIKGLWDADRAVNLNLHVVLLGSSPLLMQEGMTESLAGRFEPIYLTHWSFREMIDAFDFDLNDYLYFGGYPGSAAYIRDEARWRTYIKESLIRPSIEKDILMMTRVDKPALLRQLFDLVCLYSGQPLAFNKMLGQLQDAGNTVTLAHYLHLLSKAGLAVGLQKYVGRHHHLIRASVPKLHALNPALMTVASGYTQQEAQSDRSHWGRLVENAVGAHLYNSRYGEVPGDSIECEIYYWRQSPLEVDFVITRGPKITAIEVKSAAGHGGTKNLEEFSKICGACKKILVGEGKGAIPLVEFLSYPAEHWL